MEKTLEQRVEELEKKIAELELQLTERQKYIDIKSLSKQIYSEMSRMRDNMR